MIYIFRVVVAFLYLIVACCIGILLCLLMPRNTKVTALLGRLFAKLSPIFGIKVINRFSTNVDKSKYYVFVANHQNNFDLTVAGNIIAYKTVAVGKKSLFWIPFFGQAFWLAGNILIDRSDRVKARSTIHQIVNKMKKRRVSIWMFPEGTRNRGKGLLPFKTGAFHAAIDAQVAIVPICISTTTGKIDLNRWNNGYVIVEQLDPIDIRGYSKENVRDLVKYCHELMAAKIEELDKEVITLNQHSKSR